MECGVLCSSTTPDPAGRSTRIPPRRAIRCSSHTRHFGDGTQDTSQRVREDPGIRDWWVKREQLGMESLLSRQGTDPERFPPSPHKPGLGALGTARVEPSCSLIPCQGRAVFIFGNVKAGEEVIKLKKPRLLPRARPRKALQARSVPGSGTRTRPRSCRCSPGATAGAGSFSINPWGTRPHSPSNHLKPPHTRGRSRRSLWRSPPGTLEAVRAQELL